MTTTYDAYEIHGNIRLDDHGKPDPAGLIVDTCDDDQAMFWCLYGHLPEGGIEAIGDFESRQLAATVYHRITGQPYEA